MSKFAFLRARRWSHILLLVYVISGVIKFAAPSLAASGITFDTSSFATSSINASSMSWQHTVGSGLTESALVVGVDYYGGTLASVSSISYGSQSLAKLTRSNDGVRSATTEMWYLVNP